MAKTHKPSLNQIIAIIMLVLGAIGIIVSAFYSSSFLAILSVTMLFFGGILIYVTPTKYVPITFLTSSTTTNLSNIERLLSEFKFTEKGIYLPPKNLNDTESSLVFIPKTLNLSLPKSEETKMTELFNNKPEGLFLTPPGFALSKIFEQTIGSSFTKIDLLYLQKKLPKLLTDDLGIAEYVEIKTQNKKIILELKGSIFKIDCQEAQKFVQTHNSIGCFLSSSLACVIAKVIGKAIMIENEEQSKDGKTTTITYQMIEE